MKKPILIFGLFALVSCGGQQSTTQTPVKPEKEKPARQVKTSPLLAEGNMTLETLKAQTWYDRSYNSYNPDVALVSQLAEKLKKHHYNIDVYFGTWCHDSHREVPKLVKLLEKTGFDFSHLTLVSVNRSKSVPNVSPETAQKLNIHHVPTIIFYENGSETERFVESAKESLVKDLVKITTGQEYVDSYGG